MIKNVIKRDNRRRKFNVDKIYRALENAFKSVGEAYTEECIDKLVDDIVEKISANDVKSAHVEDIQNITEKTLMSTGHEAVAKAFILYRDERNRARETKLGLVKTIREIIDADLKTSSLLRDNGNVNGAIVASSYAKVAGETMKMYNLLNQIRPEIAKAHKDGDIHIHDLDYYSLTANCFFIPLGKLLSEGFETGNGWIRPAQSISTACQLAAIVLQTSQNAFFGGQAFANFDFELAPYVDRSFRKNIKAEIDACNTYGIACCKLDDTMLDKIKTVSMNDDKEYIAKKLNIDMKIVERAIAKTDRDTYQGMESFIHNVNGLFSRSGNQLPFSSVNFGLDTSNCGRMVSLNLIKATEAGLGDGSTPIFPISICKMMKGYTVDPADPNYDIFKKSCICCSKRFYPNFVNVDAPFNKVYVKYDEEIVEDYKKCNVVERNGRKYYRRDVGDYWEVASEESGKLNIRKIRPETTISTMGCADGEETLKIKNQNSISFKEMWEKFSKEYLVTRYSEKTEYINLEQYHIEVFDNAKQDFVKCKKLIKNTAVNNWTEVKFSNDITLKLTDDHPLYLERGRTYVKDIVVGDTIRYLDTIVKVTDIKYVDRIADSYDVETESDKFELSGFNSGNCRTRSIGNVNGESITTGKGNLWFTTINIPAIAIRASKTANPIESFWKELDEKMVMARTCMEDRYALIKQRKYKNMPFPMQNGLYIGSDKHADPETTIESAIKNGSNAIGYIGIYEACLVLLNKVYGKDKEANDFGYSIVKRIREYTDKVQKETHMNWTTFATPAENVCGRFAEIDERRYGSDKSLTIDKEEIFGKGYYTNSHMAPFDLPMSLEDKLNLEAPFHNLSNGGHIFYYKVEGDPSQNPEAVETIVMEMYKHNMGYYTITFDQDTCRECGFRGIIGDTCPKCGTQDNGHNVMRIRRITGYLIGRPQQSFEESWGNGKQAELKRRVNI